MITNRKKIYQEWNKSNISDENLKQVIDDLKTILDVCDALGETGIFTVGFRLMLTSAEDMYSSRLRDRLSR